VSPVTLNVDRETAKVSLRYTPTPNWNIRLDYSHEDRNGNQGFGTAINGFNTIELPAPISYTTQNFSGSVEYAGDWATDKRWNLNLTYNGSIFENKYESFTWDNPFRLTAPGGANTANEGRNSLPPDNHAHRMTLSGGIDLPFDSRYVGTYSYSIMRQNEAFMPFTINPTILSSGAIPMTNLSLLPAPSLDGKIDEILINNVLTTRFDDELTGTVRFRYLSVDNNTPLLFFPEYVRADGARQNDDRQNYRPAYARTTSSADLNWRAMPGLKLGTSFGWERYDRDNREADVTDEYSGKIFVDFTPEMLEWMSLRASVLQAERRYDTYDALQNVGIIGYPPAGTAFLQNPLLRKFDMADRSRTKADASLEIVFEEGWITTPTGSWRKDEFGDNLANGGELGLKEETYWNAGIEQTFPLADNIAVMLSYVRENFDRTIVNRQKTVVGEGNPADNWGSRIKDIVNTFGGSANIGLGTSELLPGTIDLEFNYIYSHTDNETQTYALGLNNRTSTPQYPDVTNTFQRLDGVVKYGVDPGLVQSLGWDGEVVVKLRYAFERNEMTNWAIDSMVPYMIAIDAGANRSLFLAALNPNYDASLVTLEFGFAW
jgi:MtrB/PioB family decaheme-associated outer membrane protein